MAETLTPQDRRQIAEILERRSNDVASYTDEHRRAGDLPGSVELALTREIERLRRLAERVDPQPDEVNDD